MLAYAMTVSRLLEILGRYILQLVIHLNGVNIGAILQAARDAQCRVAREGTNLQHSLGAHHAHKHLEELTLHMTRNHAGVNHTQVCLALEAVHKLILGLRIIQDILF